MVSSSPLEGELTGSERDGDVLTQLHTLTFSILMLSAGWYEWNLLRRDHPANTLQDASFLQRLVRRNSRMTPKIRQTQQKPNIILPSNVSV